MSHIKVKYVKWESVGGGVSPKKDGLRINHQGIVNIAWVLCRVREMTVCTMCYRSLKYGHFSSSVKGKTSAKTSSPVGSWGTW